MNYLKRNHFLANSQEILLAVLSVVLKSCVKSASAEAIKTTYHRPSQIISPITIGGNNPYHLASAQPLNLKVFSENTYTDELKHFDCGEDPRKQDYLKASSASINSHKVNGTYSETFTKSNSTFIDSSKIVTEIHSDVLSQDQREAKQKKIQEDSAKLVEELELKAKANHRASLKEVIEFQESEEGEEVLGDEATGDSEAALAAMMKRAKDPANEKQGEDTKKTLAATEARLKKVENHLLHVTTDNSAAEQNIKDTQAKLAITKGTLENASDHLLDVATKLANLFPGEGASTDASQEVISTGETKAYIEEG
jgi:hypothetical protein